jgi:ribosome-associated heat shock protein Hsp15
VRLDKWLQIARVAKTRTLATKLCDLGRVRVNGTVAKPHRTVTLGDRLEIESGDWTRILVVRELHERPLAKAQAARLYEDLSPPRPAADPLARALRRPPVLRAAGSGRPTKRERRQLERALGDEF